MLKHAQAYMGPLKCHVTVCQGDNLVERLSSDDSFRVLLGQGRSQQHTQVMTSVNMERPSAAPTPIFESVSFQPDQQLFQHKQSSCRDLQICKACVPQVST